MCNGCRILKGGEPSVDEYLDMMDGNFRAGDSLKRQEQVLRKYLAGVDDATQKKKLDTLLRKQIRLRREYNKIFNDAMASI